jgi:type VI protein secretion system component Hcp
MVTNEVLKTVELTFRRGTAPVAKIKLTNATVANYTASDETEHWSFVYQKIEWTWANGGFTAYDDWNAK